MVASLWRIASGGASPSYGVLQTQQTRLDAERLVYQVKWRG